MSAMRRKLFSTALIVLTFGTMLRASDKDRSKKFDKALTKQIEAILARPELATTQWGIDIISLDDHRTLYALNEEKLFIPASNCKLITTAATLAMIGPDYRFHTTVETTGQLDGRGRIIGDVSLVGRGDPNLSGRDLPYNVKTERSRPALWVLDDRAVVPLQVVLGPALGIAVERIERIV